MESRGWFAVDAGFNYPAIDELRWKPFRTSESIEET